MIKRYLPVGRTEFELWSARIMKKAGMTATAASQKFVLCNILLGLTPTQAKGKDSFFVNSLRKFATNQLADTLRAEIRASEKDRMAAEEAAKQQNQAAVTPEQANPGGQVLDIKRVQTP